LDSKLEGKRSCIEWQQTALNFFINGILICQGYSKIFELLHPFKECIMYLYDVILTSTSAEIKERVELYFYSTSVPSWLFIEWNFFLFYFWTVL
jgi:hypothetical protein